MTSVTLLVPVVLESGVVVSMPGRVVWVSSAMVKISIRVERASVRTVESEEKVHMINLFYIAFIAPSMHRELLLKLLQ